MARKTIPISDASLASLQAFFDNADERLKVDIQHASGIHSENDNPSTVPLNAVIHYAIEKLLVGQEKSNKPLRANTRVMEVCEKIMSDNVKFFENGENWNVTAITNNELRRHGINHNSIKKYMSEYGEKLRSHHESVGVFDPIRHNRYVKKDRIERSEGSV